MARQIINTGTVPNDGTGDPLRTALTKTNENFEEIYPITETVTKTVAADGDPAGVMDFDDFHTAMRWVEAQNFIASGKITLMLEDGEHLVQMGTSAETYTFRNTPLLIKGASADKTVCSITLPAGGNTDDYVTIFNTRDSYFYMNDINFDPTINGNLGAPKISLLRPYQDSVVWILDTNIQNCYVGISAQESTIIYLGGTTVFDNINYGVAVSNNGTLETVWGNPEFKNCGDAISMYDHTIGSTVSIVDMVFTDNTTDFPFPVNKIQRLGSVITDGTEELVPYPITESVTKTVAADGDPAGVKDFDTFHEAITWANNLITIADAVITLSLEDGNHLVASQDQCSSEYVCYSITTCTMAIKSTSGNASLCNITYSGEPGYSSNNTIFYIAVTTQFRFDDVTLDGGVAANPPAWSSAIEAQHASYVVIENCVIKDFTSTAMTSTSISRLYSNNCNVDNCYSAYRSLYQGSIRVAGTYTVSNCSYAFYISSAFSTLSVEGSATLINNSVDYNVSVNVIYPNGSYITDGTVPLIQADSVGTTAERPTARQIGHAYFDTTLGYSINWDGTNWVDSTGTTV